VLLATRPVCMNQNDRILSLPDTYEDPINHAQAIYKRARRAHQPMGLEKLLETPRLRLVSVLSSIASITSITSITSIASLACGSCVTGGS
jgi:hypothetical protein